MTVRALAGGRHDQPRLDLERVPTGGLAHDPGVNLLDADVRRSRPRGARARSPRSLSYSSIRSRIARKGACAVTPRYILLAIRTTGSFSPPAIAIA